MLVVAGNKIDRERERQVPQEEAESYANSIGGVLLGTSAKQGKGVEQAFLNIARRARPISPLPFRPVAELRDQCEADPFAVGQKVTDGLGVCRKRIQMTLWNLLGV